jgi:hypothetical protein
MASQPPSAATTSPSLVRNNINSSSDNQAGIFAWQMRKGKMPEIQIKLGQHGSNY